MYQLAKHLDALVNCFQNICVASLERFVLLGVSRNVKILLEIWPKKLKITWVVPVGDEVCLDKT